MDGPRSRRGPDPARRVEPAGSTGPRPSRDGSSLGPASRAFADGTSQGPASRVVTESSHAPRTSHEPPRTGRTQPYELLHLGDTDLIACVGPTLLVLSHEVTLEAVDAMGRGMAKLEHRYGKLSSLSIVERNGGRNTTPEARDALTDLARKHDRSLSGAAVVCEGTGFRATAIRSVVTAIHMASRSSHSSKVFSEPEPAVQWLATTRSDGALDVRLLLEATELLRAKLQARHQRAVAREAR